MKRLYVPEGLPIGLHVVPFCYPNLPNKKLGGKKPNSLLGEIQCNQKNQLQSVVQTKSGNNGATWGNNGKLHKITYN